MLGRALLFALLPALFACAKPRYESKEAVEALVASSTKGCALHWEQVKVCLDVIWSQPPKTNASNEFILTLFQESSQGFKQAYAPEGTNIDVFLWMHSMNHGSRPVEIVPISPGVFQIRQIFFIMPGDWDIHVRLRSDKTVLDEARLKLVLR